MQNKALRFGPQYVETSATNILSPGTTQSGVINGSTFGNPPYEYLFITLRHIRVVNSSSSPQTVSLFIGENGESTPGTEFAWSSYTIGANQYLDWYGSVSLYTGDYLVGLAGSSSVLTIEGEGEVGIG